MKNYATIFALCLAVLIGMAVGHFHAPAEPPADHQTIVAAGDTPLIYQAESVEIDRRDYHRKHFGGAIHPVVHKHGSTQGGDEPCKCACKPDANCCQDKAAPAAVKSGGPIKRAARVVGRPVRRAVGFLLRGRRC